MKPVFLDTVGLIALWDETDQWHVLARPVFISLLAAQRKMVTTTSILLECGNAAARRSYRPDVCDLRMRLMADESVIEPTLEEIDRAWSDYRTGVSGDAGIVDQISFGVMRRLGLTDAFTNDRHFQAAGFTTLF